MAAAGYAALATANDFTANQRIIKSAPTLRLNDSSQAADRKSWRMGVTGLTMFLGAETDEGTAGYNFLVVTRSATYAQTIAFAGGALTFNGQALDNPTQMNGVASSAYARLDQAQTFNGGQGSTPVNATYGTTITLNMASGNYHRVALTGNATLAAPSAGRPGQVLVVRFVQSTAGGWSVTWNTVFRFTAHTAPTLTNSLSAVDIFCFIYDDVDGYWQQAGLDVGR